VNIFQQLLSDGTWPVIALGNIALLGAFAGYAGGGGLSNATYSNFVRDKGWGMEAWSAPFQAPWADATSR